MEKVKNDSKNVHKKRPLFFHIGLVLSLAMCFAAFEVKVYISEEDKVSLPIDEPTIFFSDKIKPTVQPPKPKPRIEPIKKNTVAVIVEKQVVDQYTKETKEDPIDLDEMNELMGSDGPSAEKVVDPTVYIALEHPANFDGGVEEFYKFISDNVVYPKLEKRRDIQGKVFLEFIIEIDGSITDIKVVKSVSAGIDAEAVRVLKAAPNWNPGMYRGQAVRSKMTLPINFQLQ